MIVKEFKFLKNKEIIFFKTEKENGKIFKFQTFKSGIH